MKDCPPFPTKSTSTLKNKLKTSKQKTTHVHWTSVTVTKFLFLPFFHADVQTLTFLPPRVQNYHEDYCHPEDCTCIF